MWFETHCYVVCLTEGDKFSYLSVWIAEFLHCTVCQDGEEWK